MSKYCCLFAHYNSNNTIDKYVFELLDYFASLDCETTMISNSPLKSEDDKLFLKNRFKGRFLERENAGYDFGAWQYAINIGAIPDDTEYLFLANDSVFGPLFNMDNVIKKMLSKESVDFWGLTDSNNLGWHLQSYFLCFNRKVFTSKVFKNFFKQNFSSFNKTEIIENGEIGLSNILIQSGFKGEAFIPYEKFIKEKNSPFRFKNPTHFFTYSLIKDFKFPFIKKEFVFQNPENIELPEGVFEMLEKETDYPISYIQEAIISKCSVANDFNEGAPIIDVICHIYYLNTAYNFLIEISALKKYNCRFFFNLSDRLYADPYFVDMLLSCFNDPVIIKCSNIGKDIGGKLAIIDLLAQFKKKSDFTILLHDKQSLHTSLGGVWRKKLFRIIELDKIPKIMEIFAKDGKIGIVASKEFIKNEYNRAVNEFDSSSNEILKKLIKQYKLKNKNFDFVGGTMFWIRTEIINNFFLNNDPLVIRGNLEKGNVLDHYQGTETHAWERMLSWIAIDQNYKITGINE